jgi:hypothetical protein
LASSSRSKFDWWVVSQSISSWVMIPVAMVSRKTVLVALVAAPVL